MDIINNTRKKEPTFTSPIMPTSPKQNQVWFDSVRMKTFVYLNNKWYECFSSFVGGDLAHILGGYEPAGTILNSIEQINMSFGGASLIGTMSNKAYGASSTGSNSTIYGYVTLGMVNGVRTSTMERYNLNTGLFDSIVGTLSAAMNLLGYANSSRYGYALGGYVATPAAVSYIHRTDFASSSGVSNSGNLATPKMSAVGLNSSLHGFAMYGGSSTAIDRITFPHDSGTATILYATNISNNLYSWGVNSSLHGFMAESPMSTIRRLAFPFDSGSATLLGTMWSGVNNSNFSCAGFSSTNFGFSGCGGDSNRMSYINRISFPFDSGNGAVFGYSAQAKSQCMCFDNTDFVARFV